MDGRGEKMVGGRKECSASGGGKGTRRGLLSGLGNEVCHLTASTKRVRTLVGYPKAGDRVRIETLVQSKPQVEVGT